MSVAVIAIVAVLPARATQAQPSRPDGGSGGQTAVIHPNNPRELSAGRPVTAAELAAAHERLLARRDAQAASPNPAMRAAGAPPTLAVAGPSVVGQRELPGDLVQPINRQNPLSAGANGSTLTEPATGHKGDYVIYTGNTYASYSTDRGQNWTQMTLPAGPTGMTIACCDMDVLYDPATDKFYWILLYIDAGATIGTVRIFVQSPGATGATPWSCSYDYQPASDLPDYPHLGLTANYLYLNTNEANNWRVIRWSLAQLSTCIGVTTWTYSELHTTYGHRVTVPSRVPTGSTTMYWVIMDAISGSSATALRIFSWPESVTASGVTSVQRSITASNQVNPDCRGGTGNFDWIERTTAWSTSGFRLRVAVSSTQMTVMWNSAKTSSLTPAQSQTQAHIRAAQFAITDLTLTAEPHISNSGYCFGFPQIAYNQSGALGIGGFYGGMEGGSGFAVSGMVGVDDDLTAGNSYTLVQAVFGSHNRADSRWGDYTTIVANQSCPNMWTASSFALNGGNATANVDARYVEFGRSRDNCVTALATPSNLRFGSISTTLMRVLWNDTTEETYYRVAYWRSGGSYVFVNEAQDVTQDAFSGLLPGAEYYFWVQACNVATCSAWSAAISGYLLPTSPANFRATSASTSQISLAWDDATGETGYQVVWTPAAGGAYTYMNLGANVTSWNHTPVTANATYYYWLRACAGILCTGWSGGVVATAAATPAVPANLRITSATSAQIDLAWDDVTGETGFVIAWTAASPIAYNFVNLGANVTSWSHGNVTGGQTYYYHVNACAGSNCSGWSGGIAGTASAAPPAPTGFTRTGGTSTTASLAWTDVAGETSYRVAYWRSGASTLYWVTAADATSTTVTGLTPGSTYYFWIQACNGASCSGWSGPVSGPTGPLAGRPDGGTPPVSPPGATATIRAAALAPGRIDTRDSAGPPPPPDDAPPPPVRRASPPPPPPPAGSPPATVRR